MADWIHKVPRAPEPPCKTPAQLCRQKCIEWGLDFDPKRTLSGWPCVACKGGTSPPEHGVCDLCNGTLRNPLSIWRGFFATVMAEFAEVKRKWRKTYEMHKNIKRKLTPAERDYISIE